MTMSVGHAETAHRVALEVEFDQHNRLFAHHPTIVAWFDGHDLRRLVFGGAPVAVFDVDLASLEKADVRVHATVRADDRLHVDRPAKSGRIDHALHASCAGASDLELDMADLLLSCRRGAHRVPSLDLEQCDAFSKPRRTSYGSSASSSPWAVCLPEALLEPIILSSRKTNKVGAGVAYNGNRGDSTLDPSDLRCLAFV